MEVGMGSRALALGVLVAACAASSVAEELEVVLREGTNFAVARSPVDDSFILDLQGTLWRLPSDGWEATALTDGMGDDRMPHISPDGARVVFQSYRAGTWDIWAANADGSALVALTEAGSTIGSRCSRPMAHGSRSRQTETGTTISGCSTSSAGARSPHPTRGERLHARVVAFWGRDRVRVRA